MKNVVILNRERIIKLINKYYFFVKSNSHSIKIYNDSLILALNNQNFESINDVDLETLFISLQESYWKIIENDQSVKIA